VPPRRHPITEHPGTGEAVIEPSRLYAKKRKLPERAVLCFFDEVLRARAESGELEQVTELGGEGEPIKVYVHRGADDEPPVTVSFPGLCAPWATATVEELAGQGVNTILCCGGAGVLDGTIPPGHLVIPTAALRCEGTSYHYQRSGRWSRPHPDGMEALVRACRDRGLEHTLGRTWTTDGVYRETPAMVRKRRAEGCLTVEMEASAFFAVARFRGLRLAQILYAGDDVSGAKWRHRGWTELREVRSDLLDLCLDAVRRM